MVSVYYFFKTFKKFLSAVICETLTLSAVICELCKNLILDYELVWTKNQQIRTQKTELLKNLILSVGKGLD